MMPSINSKYAVGVHFYQIQIMAQYLPEFTPALLSERLGAWKRACPELAVFAMLPESERPGITALQQCCKELGISVVGAVFPALIHGGTFHKSGILLMGFAEPPYWAIHEQLPTDAQGVEQFAQQVADSLRGHLGDPVESTLFMLFDAMVPNIATLLDAMYLKLANRVHYAGTNAGSETFAPIPCLFDGERTVENAALLLLLRPHQGAVLEHGYCTPGSSVYATSTEGNRISQIDWRPAFEVYQELASAQFGVEITKENFYELAVHYPFGILRANHHSLVRIPVQLADDGSLFCVGEIPANSVLTLMESPSVDSGQTLDQLENGLKGLLESSESTDLLLFYCAGRLAHIGMERAPDELHQLSDRFPQSQTFGAVSLGEIGSSSIGGYPLFHNATLVAMPWRDIQ